MFRIIKHTEFGEFICGVNALGRYNHTSRFFRVVKNRLVTDDRLYGDIYCGAITYFNPLTKVLSYGSVKIIDLIEI